jgi:hypothetical protein
MQRSWTYGAPQTTPERTTLEREHASSAGPSLRGALASSLPPSLHATRHDAVPPRRLTADSGLPRGWVATEEEYEDGLSVEPPTDEPTTDDADPTTSLRKKMSRLVSPDGASPYTINP